MRSSTTFEGWLTDTAQFNEWIGISIIQTCCFGVQRIMNRIWMLLVCVFCSCQYKLVLLHTNDWANSVEKSHFDSLYAFWPFFLGVKYLYYETTIKLLILSTLAQNRYGIILQFLLNNWYFKLVLITLWAIHVSINEGNFEVVLFCYCCRCFVLFIINFLPHKNTELCMDIVELKKVQIDNLIELITKKKQTFSCNI